MTVTTTVANISAAFDFESIDPRLNNIVTSFDITLYYWLWWNTLRYDHSCLVRSLLQPDFISLSAVAECCVNVAGGFFDGREICGNKRIAICYHIVIRDEQRDVENHWDEITNPAVIYEMNMLKSTTFCTNIFPRSLGYKSMNRPHNELTF